MRLYKQAHAVYKTQYHIVWGKGYFVSTVGINENIIKHYVQMQGEEDAGQAQLELKWVHACEGVEIQFNKLLSKVVNLFNDIRY